MSDQGLISRYAERLEVHGTAEYADAQLQGGTIRGSLNLPAQSLYPTIPTLYSLLSNSGVKHVVWYCGQCCHFREFHYFLNHFFSGG